MKRKPRLYAWVEIETILTIQFRILRNMSVGSEFVYCASLSSYLDAAFAGVAVKILFPYVSRVALSALFTRTRSILLRSLS